jgi:ParB family transcriptional regulator, chromosome partitioning protein
VAAPTSKYAPAKIGVKNLKTLQLEPNPHNPRLLFDAAPMKILRDNIEKVGILVPLTVYQRSRDGHFVILDGQRRWICAQELGISEVPVNQVAEPSLIQNIVTMFQIHKLRQDWELMPTALKLEVLMGALKERGDAKLANLTGLDRAVVVRCKKLLSYPKEFQDRMLDPNPDVRVKADFFIELYALLSDRTVKKMPWFSRVAVTRLLLKKYLSPNKPIRSVTDFRQIKQSIAIAVQSGRTAQVSQRLKEFVEIEELTPEHVRIESASRKAQARTLKTTAERLSNELRLLDVNEFIGEEALWVALEYLLDALRKQLLAAGRRVPE